MASVADVQAQEIKPRAYSNMPIGINFLLAGYNYAEGGLVTDLALPLEGQSGRFDVILPHGSNLFADNAALLGGKRREQNPIYSVKSGLIYGFRNGTQAALNGIYFTGGRTTLEGIAGNDLQKNSLGGITVALSVNRNNSVKLYATTGISPRMGTDSDTIGIAWQDRWGGGL